MLTGILFTLAEEPAVRELGLSSRRNELGELGSNWEE